MRRPDRWRPALSACLLAGLAAAAVPGAAQPSGAPAAADGDFAAWLADPRRCDLVPTPGPDTVVGLGAVLRAVVCRSPALAGGAGAVEQARAAVDRASAFRQPSAGIELSAGGARGQGSSASAALRLDVLLFDFGSGAAAATAAREALRGALGDLQAQVLEQVGQGARLYTDAQAAWGRLDAAARTVRTALDSTRVAQARHGAGAATLSDKLQAETALAQARLEHARARTDWQTARGALALAMGVAAGTELRLPPLSADDEISDVFVDVAALVDEARQHHPRVVAARARASEARAAADATAAQRWGSVGASARTGQVRSSFDGSVARSTTGAVSWTIPLLDRELARSQRREAEGQFTARSAAVEDAERAVALQVWQEGQAFRGERGGLQASRQVLDSAEAALRVATERYRLGVGSFADVLSAQTAAARARLQWVESRAALLRAQVRLAAAVGRFGPGLTGTDPAR